MVFWQNDADLIFGGITIVCGILGTLAGGFVLDYINSTISNAFKVGVLCLLGSRIPFLILLLNIYRMHYFLSLGLWA